MLVQKLNRVEADSRKMILEFDVVKEIMQGEFPQVYQDLQDLKKANEKQNLQIFRLEKVLEEMRGQAERELYRNQQQMKN